MLRLFQNARTWPELEDLICFGRSACWHDHGNKACDKRLARLIRYFNRMAHYRQHCVVGDPIQGCKLGFFQDASFARDLPNSNSTSGRVLCVFWITNSCSNFQDVQETNCRVSQQCRIRHNVSGRVLENGGFSGICKCGIVFWQHFSQSDAEGDTPAIMWRSSFAVSFSRSHVT